MARASGSYPECRWFKSDRRYHMARWSSGQDIALSRRRQEFDSPTGHHLWVLSSAGRAHASHAWGRRFKSCSTHQVRGINSVVECHLAKVKVASPNLVSRSRAGYCQPFFSITDTVISPCHLKERFPFRLGGLEKWHL